MYIVDPFSDPRWRAFTERHASACALHTSEWLRALSQTYRYEPIVVSSCPPGSDLTDGVPLCRVESWATGRRLVSLPFTDHCQPLADSDAVESQLVKFLAEFASREKYRFCELRPVRPLVGVADEHRSSSYSMHWLDLTAPIDQIYSGFHKESIQRKIRRSEREKLAYREGTSPEIIDEFYRLQLRTRRRHQLPPQPIAWFRNLAQAMGESIQFRIALKDDVTIAAIVTLTHRNSIIYKYGGSDERYHSTGCMPFLFWRTIQEAKAAGIPLMDFGRSDLDNPGLIRFKEEWGTRRTELSYYRFPAPAAKSDSPRLFTKTAKALFSIAPNRVLTLAGKLIYRHMG